MTVEVKVTANLQKMVGGKRSVQAEGASVRELLDDLDRRYPGSRARSSRTARSTASSTST